MSRREDVEEVLGRAEGVEKKYDWVKAADLYRQALRLVGKKDFLKKGKVRARIGYCLYRSAFQAENQKGFKGRMLEAVAAYEKAAELFEDVEGLEKQAEISHCKAMVAYANSWLAADSSARREQLDECWRLEREGLRAYEITADHTNVGKACCDLMIFLRDRLEIEWDAEAREKIVEEALRYGEKAIKVLLKTEDRSELARAYNLTAFFYRNAAFARGFNAERREEYRKKALSYPKTAIEISEEISDAYLIALSNLCLAEAHRDIMGSTGLQERRHYEKALKCGILTKDNLLIANAFFGLEFVTSFMVRIQDDPDEAREEYRKLDKYLEDAARHYGLVTRDSGIAMAHAVILYPIEERSGMETDLKNRRLLLEKFVEMGYRGVEHARLSGSMEVTFHVMDALSTTMSLLAKIEIDTSRKRRLLKETAKHMEQCISTLKQASAASVAEPKELNLALCIWDMAMNQVELANTEKSVDGKIRMLDKANTNMRSARESWLEWVKSPWTRVEKFHWFILGRNEMKTGKTLTQMYALTEDSTFQREGLEAFEKSRDAYSKANLPSRVAEAYWQIAKTYDQLAKYIDSAENFESAAKKYTLAAEKIAQLKSFYMDYATYMLAWSEIEKARAHHTRHEYGKAKENYEKTSDLHKSTERWSHLSLNYLAWARLEEAEDLSRREQTEQAKNLFQQAAKLFVEAKRTIEAKLERIETSEEKQMAVELARASDVREQYCLGRIALEEAKILDRQGDHAGSSRKYVSAAETFQKTMNAMEREPNRNELRPIVDLCRAWQMVTRAEAEASPDLYLKASELFEEAKEHGFDDRAKLLALGHSRFCKALEAGTKFEDTRDATEYSTAKKHLEAAENYYLKAGFKSTSEYAKATRILFDAYMYTHKAETEIDPRKKTRYYRAAERLLQASAGSYLKAKHPEKSEEVGRLVEGVQEKRQLAMSLTEVLHGPTIASTTSFSTPTPTHEKAVGLERFEHATIEAHLTASEEVTVGQEFEIRLDLVNVAQTFGLIVRVDNLVSPGFEVTVLPSRYSIENNSLDMKGKRLEPLKVETVKLGLRATQAGVVNLSPQVIFVDEAGKFRTCKPKAVTITVHPKLTFEFETKPAQKVFDFLVSAFVEDYMKRRISLEKSGWRTLMQIVKQGRVSKSSVYGVGRRRGPAISELERRGLVEARVFPGERGRGGRILKTRIAYEKETIKRHLDRRVMKIKEK